MRGGEFRDLRIESIKNRITQLRDSLLHLDGSVYCEKYCALENVLLDREYRGRRHGLILSHSAPSNFVFELIEDEKV